MANRYEEEEEVGKKIDIGIIIIITFVCMIAVFWSLACVCMCCCFFALLFVAVSTLVCTHKHTKHWEAAETNLVCVFFSLCVSLVFAIFAFWSNSCCCCRRFIITGSVLYVFVPILLNMFSQFVCLRAQLYSIAIEATFSSCPTGVACTIDAFVAQSVCHRHRFDDGEIAYRHRFDGQIEIDWGNPPMMG